jgi:hypothetical protein
MTQRFKMKRRRVPPQRHSSGERPAVRRVSSDDPSLPQQSSVNCHGPVVDDATAAAFVTPKKRSLLQ